MLKQLADDEHWLVREGAHSSLGSLARTRFEEIYPLLRLWAKESSPNLKRAVAIAVRHMGNLKQSEMAETLIEIIEGLLSERNLYVRKNLGSYVIGDGLLRCFPDITLSYLRKWARREDEQTRWNIAMAFASYGGKRNWQAGMEILSDLATDERRYVWRAVASALRYLSKRHPEIRLTLKEWLDDPKRRKVAAEVLS
jgi:HEAT repeat protein